MQIYYHTELLASIANFSLLIVAISQKKNPAKLRLTRNVAMQNLISEEPFNYLLKNVH